ncbi:hypothetical protein MNBD_GAMMA03-1802 [hydrothermal vent metagenome]|uniref:Bsu YqfO NIF3/CutA domain n=1 Tax=hydrothermal vent metagenome TaxID=652676 RepID=A0A3B0VZE1_9ZZZZ
MYKFSFYVPETHLEDVKKAVFMAGAGKIGLYDCCAWQVKGQGQFRALEGSNPFLGIRGALEEVEEFRVEMVCKEACIHNVIQALLDSHPYEEPAYDVCQMLEF